MQVFRWNPTLKNPQKADDDSCFLIKALNLPLEELVGHEFDDNHFDGDLNQQFRIFSQKNIIFDIDGLDPDT